MSGVKVAVTFRHTQPKNALRHYTEGKIHRIGKYSHGLWKPIVVLPVDSKERQMAEIELHTQGAMIHRKEETDDLYSAIDLVIDKLQRQVQKHKEKPSSIVEGRKIENYRLSN